ncbi:hypothetical protein PF008_g24342 [Phytophthora fragariae]|uniref:Uncharacterized protein n=1 Tax=Phytophthora fragariae TaxID=53985 RepID=A0A6G0QN57_9STRA|nr:hypothetical protein PF008_g24342 [Phytophthora fragariae]
MYSLEVTDELLGHVSAQGIVLVVGKLKSLGVGVARLETLSGCKGQQSIEDSYEPLTDLAKDIHILVGNYDQLGENQEFEELSKMLQ